MNPDGLIPEHQDSMIFAVDPAKPNLKPLTGIIVEGSISFVEEESDPEAFAWPKEPWTMSASIEYSKSDFEIIKTLFGMSTDVSAFDDDPMPNWEDEESGDHTCSCAYLGERAPCGHCTDCPICNCVYCEDFHFTDKGERCPRCRACNKFHDARADGLCPYDLQVSGRLTQGDLLDKFNEFPDEELEDRLKRVAGLVANDILETVNQTYTKGSQVARKIADDYELAQEENDE